MSGSLSFIWDYLAPELWDPLADYSTKGAAAPPDLFGDLFAAAEEFLAPRPTVTELEEARNNPIKARQRFLALRGTDFASEWAIVHFLEDVHIVIADYEIPGYEDFYRRLLSDVIRKFNLRYRLDDPFVLRVLLHGSFTNLYVELYRFNLTNSHLASLWSDFEEAFDRYARTQHDSDLKTSIAKASNYLEGLASATKGKAGTLGKLCDGLTDWPHERVKDAVKNLYGFCSDYPGIRHAGNPVSQKRQLDMRDSVAINVSLMALAAYLSSNLNQASMLGLGIGSSVRTRIPVFPPQMTGTRSKWLSRLLVKLGLSRT